MAVDRSQFEMRQRVMPDHMAKLDRLTAGSLKGAKAAVVTITDAVIVDARRGNDERGKPKYEPALVLRYKEFPKRVHWLNKMGVNILCDVFGEEETEWVGQQVAIVVSEKVKNPTDGGTQDMVWIANGDEWPRLFKEDEEARARFGNATAALQEEAAAPAAVAPGVAAAREAVAARKAKNTPKKNASA